MILVIWGFPSDPRICLKSHHQDSILRFHSDDSTIVSMLHEGLPGIQIGLRV